MIAISGRNISIKMGLFPAYESSMAQLVSGINTLPLFNTTNVKLSREQLRQTLLDLFDGKIEEMDLSLLQNVLIFTSFCNDLDHICLILEELEKIPEKPFHGLGKALYVSAHQGYIEILKKILSSLEHKNRIFREDIALISMVLSEACIKGQENIVQQIISHPELVRRLFVWERSSFAKALTIAVMENNEKIALLMLSDEDIGKEILCGMFHQAHVQTLTNSALFIWVSFLKRHRTNPAIKAFNSEKPYLKKHNSF